MPDILIVLKMSQDRWLAGILKVIVSKMPTGEFSGSNRCSPSSTGSFADLGPLHNKHFEYCGDHITQIWRKCHCLGQMDLVMSGFHHYGCGGIFLDFGKQEVQQEGTGQSKKQQEIDK